VGAGVLTGQVGVGKEGVGTCYQKMIEMHFLCQTEGEFETGHGASSAPEKAVVVTFTVPQPLYRYRFTSHPHHAGECSNLHPSGLAQFDLSEYGHEDGSR
jgi:hypothetical protein